MKTTQYALVACCVLLTNAAASSQEPAKAVAGTASQSDAWESRLKNSGWSVQGPSKATRPSRQGEPAWLTAQYSKGALYLVLVDLQCSASLMLDATAKEKLKAPSDAESVTRMLGVGLSVELRQSRAYGEVLAYLAAATGSGAEETDRAIRAWIGSLDWAAIPMVNDDESRAEEFRPVPGLPSIRILARRSTVSVTGERYGLAAVEIRTLEK